MKVGLLYKAGGVETLQLDETDELLNATILTDQHGRCFVYKPKLGTINAPVFEEVNAPMQITAEAPQ